MRARSLAPPEDGFARDDAIEEDVDVGKTQNWSHYPNTAFVRCGLRPLEVLGLEVIGKTAARVPS